MASITRDIMHNKYLTQCILTNLYSPLRRNAEKTIIS